jgi:ATP-dependent RNA helicase DDX5/DBP2
MWRLAIRRSALLLGEHTPLQQSASSSVFVIEATSTRQYAVGNTNFNGNRRAKALTEYDDDDHDVDQRTAFQRHKERVDQDKTRYLRKNIVVDRYNPFQQSHSDKYNVVHGYAGRSPVRHNRPGAGQNLKPVDYSKVKLSPVEKNIYEEHPNVTARSKAEVDAWLKEHGVTLNGSNIPKPVMEFGETNFGDKLVAQLKESYERPTVIQSISWPTALSGRDMISVARTGSGKTLGFLLPGLLHTKRQPARQKGDGPAVLVLSPTRELAQQVVGVAEDYVQTLGLRTGALYGGAGKGPQQLKLQMGLDVCVACPGRLLDFLEEDTTNLQRCTYLVLDEADRMLDMGFEPQIRSIVSQIRSDRQTLMFSATWPTEVRELADDFLRDPVFLNVGSLELSANPNITQHVQVVDEGEKETQFFRLLKSIVKEPNYKVIVFTQTKRKADNLTRAMRRARFPAVAIHGDKSQTERDWVLNDFRNGNAQILVATDVAARGIDVTDISHVVNYDMANDAEDYVHRIGRTARIDRKGDAYTFFTWDDGSKAPALMKVLKEANQVVPPELIEMTRMKTSFAKKAFSRYNSRRY